MHTKKCKKCGRELPLECFRECKTSKGGHRNDCIDCEKKYRDEHKEIARKAAKKWKETHPMETRAHSLKLNYDREDEKYGRGVGDLTSEWIVTNIFSQPCAHCGKTGWDVIGCNRLDNSKPHTMDNVEPCCEECNRKLGLSYLSQLKSTPVDQISQIDGEIVGSFSSVNVAAKELGLNKSHIRDCCNGGYFDNRRNKWVNIEQYKNYIWRRHSKE